MRKTDVEERAEKLLRKHGVSSPPVDVYNLAEAEGIEIRPADLPEDCSATLVRTDDRAVIGVNRLHHSNRRRFSVAHELGHFTLHKGGRYIDKRTSVQFRNHESGSGTKTEEIDANRFAAALLMPREWVREEYNSRVFDLGEDSALQELSDKFEVSLQAMSFRLTNLGLLEAS